jgi:hypothetical protein
MIATSSSLRRSRFSAKLSRAPGNHSTPGMLALPSGCSARREAMTPQKSHTACQKGPISVIDHSQSS